MNRKKNNMKKGLLLLLILCFILEGCSPLQKKIREYSKDKEHCTLNTENVTQFTYQSKSYTILEDTVPNSMLGDWVGYIRQLTAIDENGRILFQEDIEDTSLKSLTDLSDRVPDAAYMIPFLNVYAAPNDSSYLIVDADGSYHKAVPTEAITDSSSIFQFKATGQTADGDFTLNPANATQLLCNGTVYQVTSETVSEKTLGRYLSIVAETVTFDTDTKKALTKEELKKIDWTGDSHPRETWFYTDVYEVSGTKISEAVAVKVNDSYYLAKAQ